MKRYLAIFGILFIGVIAGLIVRGIPIVLQVNAGGGIQADRNGDVNGDARLDMSDAVYLLLHIFRDGPQPVALAQAEPADLRGLEGSMNRIADSLDSLVALEQAEPDGETTENIGLNHPLRFEKREDGIIVDKALRKMWSQSRGESGTWDFANETCENLELAGHSDWRLPNTGEVRSIMLENSSPTGHEHLSQHRTVLPFYISGYIWSSETAPPADRYYFAGNFGRPTGTMFESVYRNDPLGFIAVRDIAPNE